MPIRSELEKYLKKDMAVDSKVSSATGTTRASGSDSGGNQKDLIIECRKKNSRGESVITHRFRKGKLLGKGGFAHCYKVTCVDTDEIYAMKIVPKSTLTKTRARQKLQTEIKIHRTLQHPRVVRFEMFFEDRANVYILLELCHNHSLSELIRKTKRFKEEEARKYMLQILEATSYLHRHRIIHRDLKLGNVFLDKDWNVKMGDFGLATKLLQDSERKRTICGTPNYIAPEILEGTAGHSYQVDLWSAGVILYTMLVGRPPYESTDVKSTYRRILANVYAFPDSIPISDSAKNLVQRLLQIKPELRPSLGEILNHPFLRNGGPRLRFSTAYGLRGYASTSAALSTGAAAASAGDKVAQKENTAERCLTAGGAERLPLKTRNSNVDSAGELKAESARSLKQPRAGARATGVGQNGDSVPKDNLGNRNVGTCGSGGPRRPSASARTGSMPSALGADGSSPAAASSRAARAAVPRTGSSRGFTVYCDDKSSAGGRAGLGRNPAGASCSGSGSVNLISQVEKPALLAGASRRKEASGGGNATSNIGSSKGKDKGSETAKCPQEKENDLRTRRPLGAGGARAINGPAPPRRTLLRSASSGVGVDVRVESRAVAGGGRSVTGGGAAVGKAVGATRGRAAGLRRSSSTVGSQVETRASSSRVAAEPSLEKVTGAGKASGSNASPRVLPSPRRLTPRGLKSSTARVAQGSSPGVGAGNTATQLWAGKGGGARQKLDFGGGGGGGTPRSTNKRAPQRSTRDIMAAQLCGIPYRPTKGLPMEQPLGSRSDKEAVGKPSSPPPTVVAEAFLGAGEREARLRSLDLERDSLEIMHERLTATFALEKPTSETGAAAAMSARAGAGLKGESEAESPTPPKVWVTRYIDYSCKYGLGFLLSDGSAGVYFNDATKVVLEPSGVSFDYIERARRAPPLGVGAAGQSRASLQPSVSRHTLEEFPPELQKKVTLLNHFRGYLHELVKNDEKGRLLAEGDVNGDGDKEQGEHMASTEPLRTHKAGEPLTFLKKWLRTRNAILFRLSDRTVQVVFSDQTEILLSDEASVVTFVDRRGSRETSTVEGLLEDERTDVIKRVRYSRELIAQLLRR